ncbi:MAG: DUF4089 domain-containing protein [Cyanobacteria bacterium J083]|nr:MAG: DUF4089 domain-containing protein [Cyanobacteria bacterium J083]
MNETTTKNLATYVEITAQMLNLNLKPEYLAGTISNFVAIATLAYLVTDFKLPEEIEAAPIFRP